MKLFDENMQVAQVGNFQFSGARPDKLGSPEYTLATMVTDITGSVRPYAADLLAMKQAIVQACAKSPRRNFLMLRDVEFNTNIGVDERHGFAELRMIDPAQYTKPDPRGMTNLYDAAYQAVAATNEYAKMLADQDFMVNAVIFQITDGDDTDSIQTPASVAKELMRGVQNEWLESIVFVLIGINDGQFHAKLEQYKVDAGMAQYVPVGEVTPQKLAKLADFVSRSISSQSQSLGTGGPSQALVF